MRSPRDTVLDAGSTPQATAAAPRGLAVTFRALRYRGYRYLWLGQMGNSAALWMEQVIRPLLMIQLTGSALQLGLVIAARTVPMFVFGLLAGAVADRYDRRRILIITQAVTLVAHLALGLVLLTGRVEVWHIFATAVIVGGSNAFKQPARQSMVPRLVPPEDLLNAVALNSAAMNLMRVAGAGLAGVLLIALGYGEIYVLIAAIHVGMIWTTMQLPSIKGKAERDGSRRGHGAMLWSDLAEGLRYIRANRQVLWLVAVALLIFVLGQPYQTVFIPLIGLEVLDVGRSGTGVLLALTGVGALVGSLVMASQTSLPSRGVLMLVLLGFFSFALVLFSQSPWLILSGLALVLAGGMSTAYMALHNSLLIERTPREYHGRVMSLMSLDRGLMSVGAILSGSLAELLGASWGLTVIAGIAMALTLATFLFVPVIRNMK